ncbi:MAG: hypothetical protein H0T79_08640, partial [Deltaproteobacteria bacterium]|nr:hypothetical protein [Deltaproteobacteria bacterium]
MRRVLGRVTPLHVLLVVALGEVSIDRVAVPLLRPDGEPPGWHTALAFFGLFLFYFTGVLATIIVGARCLDSIRRGDLREMVAHAIAAIATILAAIPLFVAMPAQLGVALEFAFGIAVIALVASAFARDADLGSLVGLGILAIPLLLHVANAIGAHYIWPDTTFDGPGPKITQIGVLALAFVALGTPYCFAPRPFSRAVTRPVPVIVAMLVAATGAVISRIWYPTVTKGAALAVGVDLEQGTADPRLALYLLAIATLVWTLASCLIAGSAARRRIGLGLALIVLGGYGFKWPNHYLLPLIGIMLIAEATRRVRDEELAAMPLSSATPPIADAAWSGYITTVTQGLKRTLADVHSLTARGEGGLTSSVIVGEVDGTMVRMKIERVDGSVLALDVVFGREIDEIRGATLAVWTIPDRDHGVNPAGPSAIPAFRSGDTAFDERFKSRGSAEALATLFDANLRARAVASLGGWLAYWQGEGLRYRLYPGHGAPLDQPMPLSDLALGRPASAEQLVAVIELLVEVATRVVR